MRKRFHKESKAAVERAILLDNSRPELRILWPKGLAVYLEAKTKEVRVADSLENPERTAKTLMNILGDIVIEDTSPEAFKSFMGRCSTPKVANHHQGEVSFRRH